MARTARPDEIKAEETEIEVKEAEIEKVKSDAKVKIKIPVVRGEKNTDVYVSVNDRSFAIKRGVEVEVPWFVAEALRDSEDAEIKAYSYIEQNAK